MNVLSILLVTGLGSSAALESAKRAYERGEYQRVVPLLLEARSTVLTDREAAECWEYEALTRAAFDDEPLAVEAFRRLLGISADFKAPDSWSPKVVGLLERARLEGPLGYVSAPPSAAPPASAPPPPPEQIHDQAVASTPSALGSTPKGKEPAPVAAVKPLTARWWFWTAVGVVVVGAATGVVLATTVQTVPKGSLGSGDLK